MAFLLIGQFQECMTQLKGCWKSNNVQSGQKNQKDPMYVSAYVLVKERRIALVMCLAEGEISAC